MTQFDFLRGGIMYLIERRPDETSNLKLPDFSMDFPFNNRMKFEIEISCTPNMIASNEITKFRQHVGSNSGVQAG
jgi:hypothetical protein